MVSPFNEPSEHVREGLRWDVAEWVVDAMLEVLSKVIERGVVLEEGC